MTTHPIPVFFSNTMVAPNAASFSPSASKPGQVVASWQRLGLPLRLLEPTPATPDELALAHDRAYVEGVLACRRDNGFGNRSREVAASLPFTTGAMLSAARHVLASGERIAAAPCSGFHHARHDRGAGFCTFNGLMVTAAALRREGRVRRIGILDLDMHFGDGTEEILDRLDARSWVRHFTGGGSYGSPSQAPAFFAALPRVLEGMRDCDLVLYQAGADPHIDDPLGGWLTTAQLAQRDAMVFETLLGLGVPVVWNLAGGYQREPDGSIPKVLEIHDNTMLACARALAMRVEP
jgi:acetoin utilization deacetylase AcuC-like enzyme